MMRASLVRHTWPCELLLARCRPSAAVALPLRLRAAGGYERFSCHVLELMNDSFISSIFAHALSCSFNCSQKSTCGESFISSNRAQPPGARGARARKASNRAQRSDAHSLQPRGVQARAASGRAWRSLARDLRLRTASDRAQLSASRGAFGEKNVCRQERERHERNERRSARACDQANISGGRNPLNLPLLTNP